MTYVQYPYTTLISLGNNLTALGERLNDAQRGAEDVDGLTDDQSHLQGAIDDFQSEWKSSLLDLQAHISKWAGLSTTIGQVVHDFDDHLATALRPGTPQP